MIDGRRSATLADSSELDGLNDGATKPFSDKDVNLKRNASLSAPTRRPYYTYT
jgi:hypothetical protein